MIQDDGGLHGGSADRTGPKGNQQSLKWFGPDAVRRVRWNRVNRRSSSRVFQARTSSSKIGPDGQYRSMRTKIECRMRANECLFTWSGSNQINHSRLLGIAKQASSATVRVHIPDAVMHLIPSADLQLALVGGNPRFSSTEFKRFFTHINCQSYL